VAVHESTLMLGLPHTNRWGLAEDALMKHAGHLQWSAIAETIGTPLSHLRTLDGGEVYATFYFVEDAFPDVAPIESFQLDDTLRFRLALRAFKNLAVEGRIEFDRAERLPASTAMPPSGSHPRIRFGNIFITPRGGNSLLKVAAPANGDFSSFAALPNEENPYQITRGASTTHRLGILADDWIAADGAGIDAFYAIDPERDTNGAGLVYFANYFAFLESAERSAATQSALPAVRSARARHLRIRRTAFYGNIDLADRLKTTVTFFQSPADSTIAGVRYAMRRESDDVLICLSEAIKRCVSA
jgi:probable biosynthetic protein (TIGR04098 family)